MRKSYIGVVIVIIIVIFGAVLIFAKPGIAPAPAVTESPSTKAAITTEEPTVSPTVTATASPTNLVTPTKAPPVKGVFTGEEAIEGNDVQVQQVVYDGTSFKPAALTIKVGDIVVFKNQSETLFWPASNPHPKHTLYPEFDAKEGLVAGKTFQFKFTKTGTWGFHDHLNPSAKGTVTVTQ